MSDVVDRPRSVGIVGLDYSGSTLFTAAMSALPDVWGAGETHWLTHERRLGCRECEDQPCPIITERLRSELESGADWWASLRAAARVSTVVSSDKRPAHFERFGLPDAFVYLYRQPLHHMTSRLARIREKHANGSDAAREASEWFNKHTVEHARWVAKVDRPHIAVSLETFIAQPEATMAHVCESLRLAYAPIGDFWTRDLHHVGGNFAFKWPRQRRTFGEGLQMRTDQELLALLDPSMIDPAAVAAMRATGAKLDDVA